MRVVGPGLEPWLEFESPANLGEREFELALRVRIQVALDYGRGL